MYSGRTALYERLREITAAIEKIDLAAKFTLHAIDASLASAYVAAAGRFLGRVDDNGASVALLTMVTQDPPTLRLEPFDGSDATEIQLPDDAEIQIENVGPGTAAGDRPHDFLLHFLVATGVPPHASYPTEPAKCLGVQLPFPTNTVDVGCSNSNYP